METVQILLIKPTENDYIHEIKLENKQEIIMGYIQDNIENNKQRTCQCYMFYETYEYSYYIFYALIPKTEEDTEENQLNKNVLHFGLNNENIFGNCVILKSNNNIYVNCTIKEFNTIKKRKETHRGFIIKTDDTIKIHTFKDKILENSGIDSDNSVILEYVVFDYIIKIYVDLNPKNYELNKIATRIHKDYQIYGDVLFLIVKQYNDIVTDVLNITIQDFKKVLIMLTNHSNKDIPRTKKDDEGFLYNVKKINTKYNYSEINKIIPDDVLDSSVLNALINQS